VPLAGCWVHWLRVGEAPAAPHAGTGCSATASNPRDGLTYTMPAPHFSHMGSFWAFPIEEATLVVGALTLLNPDGLAGSPGGGWKESASGHAGRVASGSSSSAREG